MSENCLASPMSTSQSALYTIELLSIVGGIAFKEDSLHFCLSFWSLKSHWISFRFKPNICLAHETELDWMNHSTELNPRVEEHNLLSVSLAKKRKQYFNHLHLQGDKKNLCVCAVMNDILIKNHQSHQIVCYNLFFLLWTFPLVFQELVGRQSKAMLF